MLKNIIYSNTLKKIMKCIFSIFYNKEYLEGYFYDEKRLGWYWAWRSLGNRLFGENRNIPWPVHPRTIVANSKNIKFHRDDLKIFQVPGCYWQNHKGKIVIGRGCYVAPNVGLITTNHDINNLDNHVEGKDIVIGDKCWIGMNAMILPGVVLGEKTIVGAGAVVTHSFPDGKCIIAGVPAKIIRKIDEDEE